MKGLLSSIALAGVLILTGCTQADHKEVKNENTEAVATTTVNEVTAAKKESVEPVESVKPEPSLKPVETKPPVTKVEKAVNKSKEANKAANSAIVDSILDKKAKKAIKPDSEAKDLLKAIMTMRTLTKDFKQKAESKDIAQVKDISEQLTQIWVETSVNIKEKYPDMYPTLNDKLTILAEKTNAAEIDLKEVIQIDYQLYQSFRQLYDRINGE